MPTAPQAALSAAGFHPRRSTDTIEGSSIPGGTGRCCCRGRWGTQLDLSYPLCTAHTGASICLGFRAAALKPADIFCYHSCLTGCLPCPVAGGPLGCSQIKGLTPQRPLKQGTTTGASSTLASVSKQQSSSTLQTAPSREHCSAQNAVLLVWLCGMGRAAQSRSSHSLCRTPA